MKNKKKRNLSIVILSFHSESHSIPPNLAELCQSFSVMYFTLYFKVIFSSRRRYSEKYKKNIQTLWNNYFWYIQKKDLYIQILFFIYIFYKIYIKRLWSFGGDGHGGANNKTPAPPFAESPKNLNHMFETIGNLKQKNRTKSIRIEKNSIKLLVIK